MLASAGAWWKHSRAEIWQTAVHSNSIRTLLQVLEGAVSSWHHRTNVSPKRNPLPAFLTSEGSVSSTRMFGPVASGPKAQMERAASKSQSYLVWKNSPSFFLIEGEETLGNKDLICTQYIYNPVPFRHKMASTFHLEQLICRGGMLTDYLVAIPDPGSRLQAAG